VCRLYGHSTDVEITQALMALAKETKSKGWWQSYGDVIPRWFEVYVGLEAAAAKISWYEPELVPGLLQTEAYARALIPTAGLVEDETEIERRVTLRMERQKILTRKSPSPLELDVVVSEALLYRIVGDRAIMAAQLRHLVTISEKVPTVRLRLVAFTAGSHHGLDTGKFEMLEFPLTGDGRSTEPATIYTDLGSGALYQEKPRELSYYQTAWHSLTESALNEEATRQRISLAIKEMENT
jgi:hypothetical protein